MPVTPSNPTGQNQNVLLKYDKAKNTPHATTNAQMPYMGNDAVKPYMASFMRNVAEAQAAAAYFSFPETIQIQNAATKKGSLNGINIIFNYLSTKFASAYNLR